MKEKIFTYETYDLHIIPTKKFKKIYVEIDFLNELKNINITNRLVLNDLLLESTKNYPSKRLLSLEYENLYNAKCEIMTQRLGKYINTSFSLEVLEEKYSEKHLFSKALDLLLEIIFNPNVLNNSFNKKDFDLVSKRVKDNILSLKEDSVNYALSKFYKEMGKNTPLSVDFNGNLKDLKRLNPKNLYDEYKKLLEENVSIFVVGNVYEEDIKKMIESRFKNKFSEKLNYEAINFKKKPVRIKERKETLPIGQSQLLVGAKLVNISDFERFYVMHIYTNILGGAGSSKLYNRIREENKLAYQAYAFRSFLDDILVCYTAIDSKNYKKTLNLIKQCLEEIKDGKFEENDIKKAKKAYLSLLNNYQEAPWLIVSYYFGLSFRKYDSLEKRKKEIEKVTKKDVVALANKIYLDTIYFLKGA